jgi:hypothetical protein
LRNVINLDELKLEHGARIGPLLGEAGAGSVDYWKGEL